MNFPSIDAIANEVIRLADERPNHIYGSERTGTGYGCYYLPRPEHGLLEGCLFGQALTNLGADMSYFASDWQPSIGAIIKSRINDPAELDSGRRLIRAMDLAQRMQDDGETWGDAVFELRKVMAERDSNE